MKAKITLEQGKRPEEYRLYNLSEAANWLDMDSRILKSEIKKEKIAAVKAGEQTYRISGESLLRYIGSATVPTLKPDSHLEDLKVK